MSVSERHYDVVATGSPNAGLPFALPWLIGLIGLTVLPMIGSLLLSLTRWDGLSVREGMEWVGLANYQSLLSVADEGSDGRLFRRAVGNSLYFTLIGVPLSVLASLGMALLLNTGVRGIALFRTVFLLPYLLGGVATILIWSWLFNPRFGIVNKLLRSAYVALDPVVGLFRDAGTSDWIVPEWFYSPHACKPALILLQLWLAGGAVLVFLAALQRVPRHLHEAALMDGANRWHCFRAVTMPHISPAVLFNLVVGVIFSMQAFDQAYLLYNRAQDDGLLFCVLYLYRVAFEPPYRIGQASAIAWIVFVVIGALVVPMMLIARRRVYYEVSR